jgi:sulfur-carrier protein
VSAKLVFLGRLVDIAGRSEQVFGFTAPLDWPDVVAWVEDCFSEELAELVRGNKVRIAVNGSVLADKAALILKDGDELAFLPPVSGG